MKHAEAAEDPRQLGKRYWSELCDLVSMGEISRADARLVAADLFEGDPNILPVLKMRVWQHCIDNAVALAEIEEFRRYAGK